MKYLKYLNLVKKRAYTLDLYESTGKEKYLRKVDAIDKVLDELVVIMTRQDAYVDKTKICLENLLKRIEKDAVWCYSSIMQ